MMKPKKLSKGEQNFRELQDRLRRAYQAEPLLLMVGLLRTTLSQAAVVLEEELSEAGLSPNERAVIYDKLLLWRLGKERELFAPLGYEKQKAAAKLLGLLDRPALEAAPEVAP